MTRRERYLEVIAVENEHGLALQRSPVKRDERRAGRASRRARYLCEHALHVPVEDLVDARLVEATRCERGREDGIARCALETFRTALDSVEVGTQSDGIDATHVHCVLDVIDEALELERWNRDLQQVALGDHLLRIVVRTQGLVRLGLACLLLSCARVAIEKRG